jgi:DNA polymerase-3 subunit epsilon
MPELKRSADHVVATAFIWKKLVELLDATWGVSRLDQLDDWLAATNPPGRSKRSFPMSLEKHRRLPDKPGIYRMLRAKNGEPEHTLEMLTQARELDFTLTGSALEAAMLESDEIKRRSPPYNIALRQRQRGLTFCTKDLCRHSAVVERNFPVGPLPAGRFIKTVSAFGLWFAGGMQLRTDNHMDIASAVLALPPDYTPGIDCFRKGFEMFREKYGGRLAHQSALRVLTALGAQLWRERLETAALAEMISEKENDKDGTDTEQKKSGKEHIWTPEAVARSIEKMVLHSAHLIRRARWFCLLSESSLAWSSADHRDNFKMLVVLANGSVLERDNVKAGKKAPIPPGCGKSFRARQKNINLVTYDRLRVLTTELRRIVSDGRVIELRLSPKVTLNRREVIRVLRWV